MPIDNIILDSSPIICLHKSCVSDLLPQRFTNTVVPDAVKDEVMVEGAKDLGMDIFFTNK
jgi:hypothetical protein